VNHNADLVGIGDDTVQSNWSSRKTRSINNGQKGAT